LVGWENEVSERQSAENKITRVKAVNNIFVADDIVNQFLVLSLIYLRLLLSLIQLNKHALRLLIALSPRLYSVARKAFEVATLRPRLHINDIRDLGLFV